MEYYVVIRQGQTIKIVHSSTYGEDSTEILAWVSTIEFARSFIKSKFIVSKLQLIGESVIEAYHISKELV